jgi:hypothetical protein
MAFTYQQSVAKYNKEAIPGDRANNQEVIYTPINLVTPADLGTAVAVKVGNFAWRKGADQAVGAGTGAPVGFVERVQNYQYYDIDSEGTLVVPNGAAVEIAVKGDFFVQADASVSVGDTVYANNTTGAATFSSSGATDTGFKAFTAGASGDMVIITKR